MERKIVVEKSQAWVGYVLLVLCAGGFLAARSAIPVADEGADSQIVMTRAAAIALLLITLALGSWGVWLLSHDRPTVIGFGILCVLAAGPTLLGAGLNLADFLSNTGYNNFGALILIYIGRTALLAATALPIGYLVWFTVRRRRASGASTLDPNPNPNPPRNPGSA